MIPLGAIINALGITIGSLVGLAFGARLPERVRAIVFQGLGLCVLVIGFKMALLTQNPLIVIFSIVIGSVAGEMIGLEARLIRVGDWLKGRLKSSNPLFTEGMVNASVLFCIGAMAIIGSFDEGLRGDRSFPRPSSTASRRWRWPRPTGSGSCSRPSPCLSIRERSHCSRAASKAGLTPQP